MCYYSISLLSNHFLLCSWVVTKSQMFGFLLLTNLYFLGSLLVLDNILHWFCAYHKFALLCFLLFTKTYFYVLSVLQKVHYFGSFVFVNCHLLGSFVFTKLVLYKVICYCNLLVIFL